jgi:hypothetical protein
VVRRRLISPAVVTLGLHCAVTVAFVAVAIGHGVAALALYPVPPLGAVALPVVTGLIAITGASMWWIWRREFVGYVYGAGAMGVEWDVLRMYGYHRWSPFPAAFTLSSDGLLVDVGVLVLEVVWLVVTRRVVSVVEL